jgi:hypothetical protein
MMKCSENIPSLRGEHACPVRVEYFLEPCAGHGSKETGGISTDPRNATFTVKIDTQDLIKIAEGRIFPAPGGILRSSFRS